ncbi:Uncharacterised protein [BD1-7 clade bacterium]|uniref:Type I restriction modification DNA specificity domain-containing protein n=1 Tax=BD1-7 clade bacterium TaxID=2029982 RepID=A0A5S9QWT0_9GAMM|nr:Uncharacterised protein [BD1-7 clade bacterium]
MSKPELLEDYLELVTYGFTNPMPDADEGPWKITAKDVIGGEINFSTARKTTQEAYDTKLTRKSRPLIGDVLLTKDGTLGRLAIVQQKGLCINQSVAVLRPNEKILPEYLFYLLSTPEYQRQMIGDSDGTVIKHIYITRVGKMEVNIPSLKEQKERLKHLLAIDEKIKNSRQTNQTLEHIAQAIFKSWFVDFEPTRAKIAAKQAGQDPEPAAMAAISGCTLSTTADAGKLLDQLSPEQQAQLKATAALFPDAMVDSELGEIPEGWSLGAILDIAELISGGTPKTSEADYWGNDFKWASAKDVSQAKNSLIINTERSITELGLNKSSTKIIPKFSTAVVARGATTGRFTMFGENIAMNQTCYALKSIDAHPFFVNTLLKYELPKLVNSAHGSVFDTITKDTFQLSKLVLPAVELRGKYESKVAAIYEFVLANIYQTEELSECRDAILPKLLSGELSPKRTES